MASQAPFDRVDNGYDPAQVAHFAQKALTWKRRSEEADDLRFELNEAKAKLARYESVIGRIDRVEQEANEIVANANAEAERILARVRGVVEPADDVDESLSGESVEARAAAAAGLWSRRHGISS